MRIITSTLSNTSSKTQLSLVEAHLEYQASHLMPLLEILLSPIEISEITEDSDFSTSPPVTIVRETLIPLALLCLLSNVGLLPLPHPHLPGKLCRMILSL